MYKKIAAVLAAAALFTPALPASAALTGNVTVKWNTQAVGAISLYTQYSGTTSPAGQHQAAASNDIYTMLNGGTGQCNGTATSPSQDAGVAGTVNFGNVTPDSAANVTDCMEINAINAQVVTNDTAGWSVNEAAQAAVPANYALCAYPNGSASFPLTAATLPYTASARVAAVTNTTLGTCASSGSLLTTTAFNVVTNSTSVFSSVAPANMGEDMELEVGPNAPAGATTVTVVYTLVLT